MATSPLQNAVQFFKDFGLFDVVLPFLLVFSIMFAILEKTRILGEDKIDDKKSMPKRTLNAMVSFVIGMLVVATNKVVTAINTALPNVVLLAVIIISFLMLVGVFFKEGEFNFADQNKKWVAGFMVVILALIAGIFLDSIKAANGQSWLEVGFNYAINNISGPIVTSIIFLLVALGAIFFIMSKPSTEAKK